MSFAAHITSLAHTIKYGLYDDRKYIRWNQWNTQDCIQMNWIGGINIDVNYTTSKSDMVEHLIGMLQNVDIDAIRKTTELDWGGAYVEVNCATSKINNVEQLFIHPQ